MSTPAIIALRHDDGSLKSIYCHYDGHPLGVGATLAKSWAHEKRVTSLMELGDLSRLGSLKGKKRPFDTAEAIIEEYRDEDGEFDWMEVVKDERMIDHRRSCLSYKRDRDDEDAEPVVYGSWDIFAEAMSDHTGQTGAGYIYVFDALEGAWFGAKADIDLSTFEQLMTLEQMTLVHEQEMKQLEREETDGTISSHS